MNKTHIIEQCLANEFHADFCVEIKDSANEEYIIRIKDSNERYFYLDVTIKDDIRLTIICEPEKYGADFVSLINRASHDKRKTFVEYWKLLGERNFTIKINDSSVTPQWVLERNDEWKRFFLKYTKAPFCDEKDDRNEVINYAIKNIFSMILSLTDYSIEGNAEGGEQTVMQTKYERDPINRRLCLLLKGYKCSVCGFDFEEKYGEIGKGYIEVHHAIPVSTMKGEHVVNVSTELFPVCSNCHSMIHRRKEPYTIEELKQRIKHD